MHFQALVVRERKIDFGKNAKKNRQENAKKEALPRPIPRVNWDAFGSSRVESPSAVENSNGSPTIARLFHDAA